MEIRIKRQLTGRQMRDEILAKYGSREAVAKLAKKGDMEAKDALFNLKLFEEDPKRLKLDFQLQDVLLLDEADLSKLTWTRLHILKVLRELGEANVKQLTAALKRDAKNVSEDVACLMEYGLVTGHRQGKEKLLQVSGNQIVIAV
jgi:DNA-binding transcriptional ArsR family regulator